MFRLMSPAPQGALALLPAWGSSRGGGNPSFFRFVVRLALPSLASPFRLRLSVPLPLYSAMSGPPARLCSTL